MRQGTGDGSARQIGGVALITAIAIGLGGCETIEEKYGPKHVSVPPPLSGDASAQSASARGLKPEGVRLASGDRAHDALVTPEVYYGEEPTFAPSGAAGAPLAQPGVDAVTLNFVDTGILEVVDAVLGQTLGVNYVVDPRVQGSVTVRTVKPLPRAALLPTLENILALNGAALVESGSVFSVVPIEAVGNLPKLVVTPSAHPQIRGVGTYIIPLEYASVASMQELLTTQVSPGRQLAVDHLRNLLIYTGPSQEARSIADLATALDIDVLAGMSFALLPVQSADAEDVALDLEVVFDEGSGGSLRDTVRFVPIERLNAVLAISAQKAHLNRAAQWVRRLDRTDVGAGERVFVYYVRNGRATELASVLSQVFGAEPAGGAEVVARPAVAPGMRAVELISPAAENGADSSADAAAPSGAPLTADLAGAAVRRRNDGDGMRFVADERNNAVVVVATVDQFRIVEATLRRLDILPLQVLIEATIAEIELNDDLEYGLKWAFETGDFGGASLLSESDTLTSVAPAFPGFNLVLDTAEVNVVLSALSEITNIEVMSSPQLMVLDNQSARLQVGDQVPISTQTSVSTIDPEAPIVNSVEYFDTGVILEVTPRVNATGLVTLDIVQEVSDAIATETSTINSPTIQQRRIESSVAVQSGETVALGGLIRERATDSVSGIPVLMDIPLLGNLFKTTGQSARRTELLVLITPRVVRDQDEARELTRELRERLRALQGVIGTEASVTN